MVYSCLTLWNGDLLQYWNKLLRHFIKLGEISYDY